MIVLLLKLKFCICRPKQNCKNNPFYTDFLNPPCLPLVRQTIVLDCPAPNYKSAYER